MGDVGTGVVAVAGKVDPAELCQWLKRKTRKDVKIVRPRRPSYNRNKQVCIPLVYLYCRMKAMCVISKLMYVYFAILCKWREESCLLCSCQNDDTNTNYMNLQVQGVPVPIAYLAIVALFHFLMDKMDM